MSGALEFDWSDPDTPNEIHTFTDPMSLSFGFEFMGRDWLSAEQAYQAMRFEVDSEPFRQILNSTELQFWVMRGNWTEHETDKWDHDKHSILREITRCKINDNIEIQEQLAKMKGQGRFICHPKNEWAASSVEIWNEAMDSA
jgi:predicted NAD-dependent protein-ADP-ribosyltransferase YbiA (DUF1768 family)